MIKIEHLSKNFGDLEVLRDINLEVKEGEVVCIIGPSGSGKSTLLRCINRLETPSGGTILYEGQKPWTRNTTSASSGRRWAWCSSASTCFP